MTRPAIAPDVAAALLAQIPSRIVKKLDADPGLAERWTWTDDSVTTDKGDVVTLASEIRADGDIRCSCLLSPRCLHVAAVVASLPVAVAAAPPASASVTAEPTSSESSPAPAELARARAVPLGVLADLLVGGAEACGAFAQGELLRAIHACRSDGLHRLATTLTRVLRSIRELRADRPEFVLATLTADVREALAIATALAKGDATPALVGAARRDYEPIGNLRLRGLFTEAIVARSGYAGAVTYLVDDKGRVFTRADVAPGDVGRAAGAYDAAAGIGDAVLPHRELSRAGLFVSDATASADGRLGAGQQVKAVRASEPSRWDHEVVSARWRVTLGEQLARVAAHEAAPEDHRPAGWDLVFVEGELAGQALVVHEATADAERAPTAPLPTTPRTMLALTTSLDHDRLAARANLDVLARAVGLRVRAIGRVRLAWARRIELLALAPDPARMPLPEAWHGRANLHYDRLPVVAAGQGVLARAGAASDDDLLEPLRRRLERVVLGGAATLPPAALRELEREAAILEDRALRGGAEALRELGRAANTADRRMTGERTGLDREAFARAWLRAAVYDDAARRRLSLAAW